MPTKSAFHLTSRTSLFDQVEVALLVEVAPTFRWNVGNGTSTCKRHLWCQVEERAESGNVIYDRIESSLSRGRSGTGAPVSVCS